MNTGVILCIDDDEASLRIRELIFRSAGYDVISTTSSHTGLSFFAKQKFDIVVLDYCMPGLNGMEVANVMRAMNPAIPILMLSAGYLDPASPPGSVDLYLDKTTSPKELLSAIGELLSARKPLEKPASSSDREPRSE